MDRKRTVTDSSFSIIHSMSLTMYRDHKNKKDMWFIGTAATLENNISSVGPDQINYMALREFKERV